MELKITAQLEEKVLQLYKDGLSKHRIQKMLNISKKNMDIIQSNLNIKFSTREDIKKRNQEMLDLRNQGWSLESIGECYPVNGKPMTKEGVRLAIQNAVKNGGKLNVVRGKSKNKTNKHSEKCGERKEQAIAIYKNTKKKEKEIAKEVGVCEKTVINYLKDIPEYVENKKERKYSIKSKLPYSVIVQMKKDGISSRDIAEKAGLSVPRILQIIQMNGTYNPNKKTVKKIQRIVNARNANASIKDIAKREAVTEGQVYRYINLADVLKKHGKE